MDAYEYAQGQSAIVAKRTLDIFQEVVADGDLMVEEVFELMHSMWAAGRSLLLPDSPQDLR